MTGIVAGAAVLLGAALGWWGAIAVTMGTLAFLLTRYRRSLLASSAVIVVAAVLGAWRAEGAARSDIALSYAPSFEAGLVDTNPVRTGRHQHFTVQGEHDANVPGNHATPRICVTADPLPIVQLGDQVILTGRQRLAIDAAGTERAFLAARGCAGSLFATTVTIVSSAPAPERALAALRARIDGVLRRAAPGDAGVLLSGLVTGDDEGFSPERYNAFIRSSTIHLTAVSGSNLALVAGIFATVGAATIGRHRVGWQVLTILGIWAYALISGVQAPAVRAAIVATAAILAFRCGRRPDFVTLIVIAAAAMVLVDPRQIDALGFRLSVASSLGLAVVLPGMLDRGPGAAVAGLIAATVAAEMATLPFLLPVFGAVSMLALPANVLVEPLVAVAFPLAAGAAMLGLASPPLGEIVAAPAASAAAATLAVVDRLGAPTAYVAIGVPPPNAAWVIAATSMLLLAAISWDDLACERWRQWIRARRRSDGKAMATGGSFRRWPDRPVASVAGQRLVAAAIARLGRKDPADAFAGDTDDPVHHPAPEEDGHQVA